MDEMVVDEMVGLEDLGAGEQSPGAIGILRSNASGILSFIPY